MKQMFESWKSFEKKSQNLCPGCCYKLNIRGLDSVSSYVILVEISKNKVMVLTIL